MKRVLTLVLAVLMLISSLPAAGLTVYAEETAQTLPAAAPAAEDLPSEEASGEEAAGEEAAGEEAAGEEADGEEAAGEEADGEEADGEEAAGEEAAGEEAAGEDEADQPVFDHAVISGQYSLFVPYSTYTFTAEGFDADGNAMDIPEDAFWTLSDETLGSVEDGVFVSRGITGQADVLLMVGDTAAASMTISIVHPDALSFGAEEILIPHGTSGQLELTASYEGQDVYCIPEDFTFALEAEDAGTLEGLTFTASEDLSLTGALVTASYDQDEALEPASIVVSFGQPDQTVEEGGYGAGLGTISDRKTQLAPGITMNEVVASDRNGDRVEMYVVTADATRDTVQFYANYKDHQYATWGMQTLSEQVAAIEADYEEPFKVVAGINASYYDVNNGRPTGAFAMEGVLINDDNKGNEHSFFAVLKDGSVMIGAKGEYTAYKDQIKEAIGGYIHLVKDGAICSGLNTKDKYPRQTIGITAEGQVIIMTADGSQAPKTIGLTVQEQAEVMLALGCVEALHLDGGNSATFSGIREGTDKFVTINTPSGQVERAVSNTLMIVSTAVADGTFARGLIAGDYDYFVPHSSYTFTASGVDAAGGVAQLPADIVWALSDSSFGTMENGTFVSSGVTGSVKVQLVHQGKVVGEKEILVAHPQSITFGAAEKTAPYGKTISLEITAIYANNEMCVSPEAFTMTVADEKAGSLNGFDFTATEDSSIARTSVTAEYNHSDTLEAISVDVKFGQGSEILFDFEDGDVSEWRGSDVIDEWIDKENAKYPDATVKIYKPANYSNQINTTDTTTFLGSRANGDPVKSGDHSLAITLKRTYDEDMGAWSYNYAYYTGESITLRDTANGKMATKIGMWVHFPQEAAGIYMRLAHTFTKDATGKLYTNYDYFSAGSSRVSEFKAIPESGWVYITYDLTAYDYQSTALYNPQENYAVNNGKDPNGNFYPAFFQFFTNTYMDHADDVTIYVDDITLDYSDVTEDRDAPTISNPKVSTGAENEAALNGQTVSSNTLMFSASAAEQTGNSNATGLDYSTAAVYVDGKKVASGKLTTNELYLANGLHEVLFEIADKQGNYAQLRKTLTVAGTPVITMTGRNDSGAAPEAGSVYYLDLKASEAADVRTITTSLKLNNANDFEASHISAAPGVTVNYSLDIQNNVLNLTLTQDGSLIGEVTMASIPVRVWAWDEAAAGKPASHEDVKNSPDVDIICASTQGAVIGADGKSATFHVFLKKDTVLPTGAGSTWHVHTPEVMDDLAPGCTQAGFTGRTYCDGCQSIVAWGTLVPATGHTYAITDGILKCHCGETFTGTWTDGKTYENGVPMANGWVGFRYYRDGVLLTGIQKVEDFYYNFGTEGICEGKVKYTGLYFDEAEQVYRYIEVGVVKSGWALIGEDWHYFDPDTMAAVSGSRTFDQVTYEFEETGRLTAGVWMKTLFGSMYYYGPAYHKKGWQTIEGKDYFFENNLRYENGYALIQNISDRRIWYYFDENGVCDRDQVIPNGFYETSKGLGYCLDGEGLRGEQYIDGHYYFFNSYGFAQTGQQLNRYYGEDYKAHTGLIDLGDGVLRYYRNGQPNAAGLIEIDGDYYFAGGSRGEIAVDKVTYVWEGNGLLPENNYHFGVDGKLLDGIVEKNDGWYYFRMGRPAMVGLVEVNGDYYFAGSPDGKVTVNAKQYSWANSTDLPNGNYEFGPDGKMLSGIVAKNGTLYYYESGKPRQAGLVEFDGDYYFAGGANGEVAIGKQYVWQTNDIYLENANCEFGPDGKMLRGIVDKDGTLYYYVMGRPKLAGLIEIDGDYYFACGANGEIAIGKKYVWETNGIHLENANCEFGPDGKMLRGIVDKDGTLYYYVMGRPRQMGLIEIDGDYYFAGGPNAELSVSTRQYTWANTTDLPNGNYEFGADGKMLNGIVDKDGTLYYYVMGHPKTAGLVQIDGSYYFAGGSNGEITVSKRTYVWQGNGLLPEDNYEFGEDGKMLHGFITRDDGLYYYDTGKYGRVGLNYIDGHYYFFNYGGKVYTSGTYYVWETNGLSICQNYTFDDLGRVIR